MRSGDQLFIGSSNLLQPGVGYRRPESFAAEADEASGKGAPPEQHAAIVVAPRHQPAGAIVQRIFAAEADGAMHLMADGDRGVGGIADARDRKSTRLNSSH